MRQKSRWAGIIRFTILSAATTANADGHIRTPADILDLDATDRGIALGGAPRVVAERMPPQQRAAWTRLASTLSRGQPVHVLALGDSILFDKVHCYPKFFVEVRTLSG